MVAASDAMMAQNLAAGSAVGSDLTSAASMVLESGMNLDGAWAYLSALAKGTTMVAASGASMDQG